MTNVHKAGLLGFVKTLATELAPDGICINSVGPGRTLTPLWINRSQKWRLSAASPPTISSPNSRMKFRLGASHSRRKSPQW